MKTSLETALLTLRQTGAYGRLDDMGMIAIVGPDATRFLQSQTTNDVAKLAELSSQETCILDRKAHVKAFFHLYRKHKSFRIVAARDQIDQIMFHLDTYRFADKVEFINETEHGAFYAVQGPKALQCVSAGLQFGGQAEGLQHRLCVTKLFNHPCLIFRQSVCGEDGFIIRCSTNDIDDLSKHFETVCKKASMIELSSELVETARIESGMPIFGRDFLETNFLPEAGIEESTVSYTKGCFLGQEVLARVKSQGAPTRGLVGLQFAPGVKASFPLDTKVSTESGDVAFLRSNCFSPTLGTTIALSFVKREFRIPDKTLEAKIDGTEYVVTVKMLPFVKNQSAEERAKSAYEEALQIIQR